MNFRDWYKERIVRKVGREFSDVSLECVRNDVGRYCVNPFSFV